MELKCSLIDHKNIDAILFCQICKVYLCNKCLDFHSKLFQNHITQKLTKENKEIFTGLCLENEHRNILEYYCKNHNQLCCAACISKIKDEKNGKHKDCEIYKLIDIKPEKEKKFKQNYAKLQDISKSLEPTINEFKLLIDEVNKNKEELIKEIQKAFTNLRNALNKREEQLLLEVEEINKEKYFDDDMIKESEKLSERVKKCLESVNILKDKKNELNYEINYYIEFENNLNKINEIEQKIYKCNSNNIKITFEFNNNEIENIIKKIGYIKIQYIDDDKTNQIYEQLEEEYWISGFIEEEEAKKKIRQLNYNIEKINEWIENDLV